MHEIPEDAYEEEDDDEVVITGTSNLSKSNFETSLDNSKILNTSFIDDDPVALFCNENQPTLELFDKIIDEDKTKAFKELLSNAPESDYLTHLVFTILKLSSISGQSKEAHQTALELFKEAFEYAKTKDRLKSVRNFFLIQLGLLKSEEKSFKPKYDVQSCRAALESAIKANSLPDEEKSIFEVFLNTTK